ncbi:SPFH domain-containing protein [Sporolactobacillus spathodeae]|uniref:Regulator of protease activity HflC (Stomatin/prohibitin superfamily) n=1 Tax=Sporolactobacillus spathodeae TaxID=1465502 RepID=A0ABS2QAB6_9BACL|nr:SPFH domain-containing protein [Sporolactobacillus spathodeae]MBM7658743.1 regulator of protease activity HflC (stomatin/prohibitin superfamily) [Sporolactobacillus spathodeae]
MKEKEAWSINGYLAAAALLVCLAFALFIVIALQAPAAILFFICILLAATGFGINPPNKAAALTFFGRYIGSVHTNGLFFSIPLTLKKTVSLRVRNFNSQKLKVNDVEGNPIEIAAVVVFKVIDSAKALYNVDDYLQFVEIQSETAIRHIASQYPYDNFNEEGFSLRGNAEQISNQLLAELQSHLEVAGLKIVETRLTHLAYSMEIAQAMLQRQQAAAIIAARQKIVEGAVTMAQMAIARLEADHTVDLDEERKMHMINNLMVAIVSEKGAQPIVNTGSLY